MSLLLGFIAGLAAGALYCRMLWCSVSRLPGQPRHHRHLHRRLWVGALARLLPLGSVLAILLWSMADAFVAGLGGRILIRARIVARIATQGPAT